MTRSIIVSPDARRDLVSIAEWIAAENPQAARRTVNRIVSAIYGLADYAIGRPGRIKGTHERVIAGIPYVVIYRIEANDAGETIAVLTVRHTSRKPLG